MATQTNVPPPGVAYYQPPYPAGPPGYPPANYPAGGTQATAPTIEQPKSTTTIVINATGNCPKCLSGHVVETFTLAGICMAVWFFPCGLICCLQWKRRFCDTCGAIIG